MVKDLNDENDKLHNTNNLVHTRLKSTEKLSTLLWEFLYISQVNVELLVVKVNPSKKRERVSTE